MLHGGMYPELHDVMHLCVTHRTCTAGCTNVRVSPGFSGTTASTTGPVDCTYVRTTVHVYTLWTVMFATARTDFKVGNSPKPRGNTCIGLFDTGVAGKLVHPQGK